MEHLKKKHKSSPIPENPLRKIYSSKKTIQILLSLSLFSFLFSHPTLFPFLVSPFSMKVFSYSADRNYIFLLCNGILIIIIKNSGLFASASPSTSSTDSNKDSHVKKSVQSHQSAQLKDSNVKNKNVQLQQSSVSDVVSETKAEVTEVVLEAAESKTETTSPMNKRDQVETLTAHYQEVDELLNNVEEEFDDFEEEEEEEGNGLLSTEELNKKCDDFIRMMKYGIKFEAQHLIMV